MSLDRRHFLRRATGLAALSVISVPLIGLTGCAVRRAVRRAGPGGGGGYGELAPSRDCPELALPPDFRLALALSAHRADTPQSATGATPGP
jgi:hypothetical protein